MKTITIITLFFISINSVLSVAGQSVADPIADNRVVTPEERELEKQ